MESSSKCVHLEESCQTSSVSAHTRRGSGEFEKCLQAAAGAAVHEARLSHVMRAQPQTYFDNQSVSILRVVTPSVTCCPLSFYRSTQFGL